MRATDRKAEQDVGPTLQTLSPPSLGCGSCWARVLGAGLFIIWKNPRSRGENQIITCVS